MDKSEIKTIRDIAMLKYLHGDDLLGKELPATIKDYGVEMMFSKSSRQEEPKGILEFEGNVKPMVINKIKADELIELFPDAKYDIKKLIGKKVTIYTNREKHFGKFHEVLHVKAFTAPKKAVLDPKSDKWNEALTGLKGGTVKIAQIKKYYDLSKENEKLLIEQSKSK